jgi:hypothetical protein
MRCFEGLLSVAVLTASVTGRIVVVRVRPPYRHAASGYDRWGLTPGHSQASLTSVTSRGSGVRAPTAHPLSQGVTRTPRSPRADTVTRALAPPASRQRQQPEERGMTMKIPNMRSRAAIAVAAAAILTTGLSGTTSAATGGPAPQSTPTPPVPAPYPDADPAPNPDTSAVPSAPVTSSGPALATACTPYVDGDYAHRSKSAPYYVSAHGWWYRNDCPNTKTTVYIGLQEYWSDGVWRTQATGSKYVYPGGGSANRAAVHENCDNLRLAGWRSWIVVYIGNGASAYTSARNLYCQDTNLGT